LIVLHRFTWASTTVRDALIAGDIDAQFQPPIPNRVVMDLPAGRVRVVPYARGQLEKVLSEVPFYRSVTMQTGVFRGVVEDVAQPAVINVLVTHKKLLRTFHDMAKAIVSNLDTLPQMNLLFKGLKDLSKLPRPRRRCLEFGGVPLHPGAIRAYREAGWLK
jgi:TRAP-type uncharacterized transport system substrate-binding protein